MLIHNWNIEYCYNIKVYVVLISIIYYKAINDE